MSVVTIPSRAVFRHGDGFAVFVVDNARAHRPAVRTGHWGAIEMEIVEGLSGGEQVVVHPSNELDDSVRVAVTPQ